MLRLFDGYTDNTEWEYVAEEIVKKNSLMWSIRSNVLSLDDVKKS